jgi:uridine kinase
MNNIFNEILDKIAADCPRVIAIDGSAASGKSTFAELIAKRFGSSVFHMDDFFLPPDLKTPKRLSEPGGNVDYERFKTEITDRLFLSERLSYNKYNCQTGKLSHIETEVVFPVIIEGAYCLHPLLRDVFDLKIFLEVKSDIQMRRIIKRGGLEILKRFQDEWIPLEIAYFNALKIREICDIIADTSELF